MALTLTQVPGLFFELLHPRTWAQLHSDNKETLLFMLTWSKISSASFKTSCLLLPSPSLVFCGYRPTVCCGGVKSGGVQLWVRRLPPRSVSASNSAACFGWSVCQREIRKEDLSWLSLLTFIYFSPSANGCSCQSCRDHDFWEQDKMVQCVDTVSIFTTCQSKIQNTHQKFFLLWSFHFQGHLTFSNMFFNMPTLYAKTMIKA